MFIFKNSILPFFSLFFCLFEELHMSFSLHYNGVLHEVKFVIGHGVLKTWCHGRTPYLTFLHSYGVLHKIYFFKGCEVLKTGFCFKERHMLFIFHCNGVLHKVNFWNSHGVLPTRFLLKNSIIPFFTLQWSTPWGKLLRRLWGT